MFDYIILGAGIVGLSTAMQLKKRFPERKILVLEKENTIALHQTSHNSGVIHSGIYYKPGSFKAEFCRKGATELKQYCADKNIAFKTTGKLIVATSLSELNQLKSLFELSKTHNISVDFLDKKALYDEEPNISGLAAILVHATGIVDYQEVAKSFARDFAEAGGEIEYSSRALDIKETKDHIEISTEEKSHKAKYLIACCGLQADRIAKKMDLSVSFKIIPIRGEYYQLQRSKNHVVSRPIYPVPDPSVPFLGIHITPMMNGQTTVGPNAVVGWHREHYENSIAINVKDSFDSLAFPGFWKMGWKNKQYAFTETADSLLKKRYVQKVQRYCPSITASDLTAYPAGIRAQAVTNDGELVTDFLFAETPRSLHVCNAPSPAATSSIPIGAYLCDKIASSST